MTAPSHTKEYIAAQNHRDYLRQRARRRANPNHPCHRWSDEAIQNGCEQWATKRREANKESANRDDIYCEIICPDDNARAYHRYVESRDRKYLKQMITVYMDRTYPVMESTRHTRSWNISLPLGGEPCPATTAECLTTR